MPDEMYGPIRAKAHAATPAGEDGRRTFRRVISPPVGRPSVPGKGWHRRTICSTMSGQEKSSIALRASCETVSLALGRRVEGLPDDVGARRGYGRECSIVEGYPVAAVQVRSALAERGHAAVVACGGVEALASVEASPPDAIVLDPMMPGMDGFEVLWRLRCMPPSARTPVPILTAKDLTRQELEQLRNNNIQQLIQKGVTDRDQLVDAVRDMLKTRIPPARRSDEDERPAGR